VKFDVLTKESTDSNGLVLVQRDVDVMEELAAGLEAGACFG
jgi:hypothetical protein